MDSRLTHFSQCNFIESEFSLFFSLFSSRPSFKVSYCVGAYGVSIPSAEGRLQTDVKRLIRDSSLITFNRSFVITWISNFTKFILPKTKLFLCLQKSSKFQPIRLILEHRRCLQCACNVSERLWCTFDDDFYFEVIEILILLITTFSYAGFSNNDVTARRWLEGRWKVSSDSR